MKLSGTISEKIRSRIAEFGQRQRLRHLVRDITHHTVVDPSLPKVVIFNATSRLTGLSQNAAFTLLSAWGLRLAGIPLVHFVCQAGMNLCVLGTNREDTSKPPPCEGCIAQSQRLYKGGKVYWFHNMENSALVHALDGLDINALSTFEYHLPFNKDFPWENELPLGQMVLSSLRWALRRYSLPDDELTRALYRRYITSAYSVAIGFNQMVEAEKPDLAIIFNGIMFPEAAARWAAQQRALRVITHEVGFQRFSTFFTEGEATAYPIHIPDEFELSPSQNKRLDDYLEQRFQGKFSMAGIRFWPEMNRLDDQFLERASHFKQIVPVFTNVIYDTSQVHANTLFPHMFAWLEQVLETIKKHPETLFVIRAHPDEMRPGTAKQSRESVQDWVLRNQVNKLPNVVFIDSREYISSYELIPRSKFLIVYNSSIGLEAALMGVPVLCAGKARYTQYPIVFLPESARDYLLKTEEFLDAEKIEFPLKYQHNARRFLHYQLYKASLSFDQFLTPLKRPGFVHFSNFSWEKLLPENCFTIQTLVAGIVFREPFILEDTL